MGVLYDKPLARFSEDELMGFIDLLIATGRLLGHLRAAWRCTCEIAVIVDTHLGTDDLVDAVNVDTGL